MIFTATPDRIGIEQPEWRRVSSCREVDIDVWLFRAQLSDEMNGGVEVAVEFAARDDLVGVACAIELELVHAILVDHFEAGVAEVAVVLRARESQAAFVRLEALFPRRGKTLLFRLAVATPRRQPNSGCGSVIHRCLCNLGQPIRETGIKLPQLRGIIPAIVEHEAVEFDAALFRDLLAEAIDLGYGILLGVAIVISQVIPRVVMQECAVGMRSFEFEISEEVAA